MRNAAIVIVVLLILVGAVSCEWSIWSECRKTNSWIYCMRLMDK